MMGRPYDAALFWAQDENGRWIAPTPYGPYVVHPDGRVERPIGFDLQIDPQAGRPAVALAKQAAESDHRHLAAAARGLAARKRQGDPEPAEIRRAFRDREHEDYRRRSAFYAALAEALAPRPAPATPADEAAALAARVRTLEAALAPFVNVAGAVQQLAGMTDDAPALVSSDRRVLLSVRHFRAACDALLAGRKRGGT